MIQNAAVCFYYVHLFVSCRVAVSWSLFQLATSAPQNIILSARNNTC